MLQRQDILCISSIDWDFIWQGHQEIMSTFARQGHRVLFVENTGVRTPRLRDLPRLRKRLRNWLRGTKGFRQEQENLFVYSPVLLPFPYARPARWLNAMLMCRALKRWMRVTRFGRPILWTFLPTPLTLDVIREVDPELTVYYCIDDLASSSPQARRITRSEVQVFRQADLVFVTSEKLWHHAARFTDRLHLFPFGVRFAKFEAARAKPDQLPSELRDLPRPIAGYVGGLHQWVDQALLTEAARRLPQTSFVLVGPAQTDTSLLAQQPNIHLLGERSHDDIPRYINAFDVGIVPYRLSEYTAHVYPTKLNEYLAMGIPTVATELPEIRRFNAEFGDVVAVAQDAEHFAKLIQDAVAKDSPEAATSRIAVSRQNSWEARIARMSLLMAQALEAKRRARERQPWREPLRWLYRAARYRLARTVIGAAVAVFLVFRSPLLWWVAEPLRVAEPPRPADAIVVLAGGVGESGQAGGGYQERVKHAVDLYRQGMAPRLVLSSGYTFVFREAEVMRDLAVSLGVPASAILLETKAANTYDNVIRVAQILRANGWTSVLLVSSPYHMRRTVLTWKTVTPDIAVVPTPARFSQFYLRRPWVSLEQMEGILHEYLGIVYYWSKGWIRVR